MRTLIRFTVFACLLQVFLPVAKAQQSVYDRKWRSVAAGMPSQWYGTDEAKSIAENILLYQRPEGGWPKNIEMHRPLTEEDKKTLSGNNSSMEPTLDNNATITEMRFMAKMYSATKDRRYRKSFEKGLEYILDAQYDNGGWPQFYPLKKGYYTHITYNDNAMVNVMSLLRDIFNKEPDYAFVATNKVVSKARRSFDKGIGCILKTQIIVDGEPTVWCAQHDEVTFNPVQARSYELPSFSGAESVGIVLLLMDISDPSPEIKASVRGAVKWFGEHKVTGLRLEDYRNEQGQRDRRVVPDTNAPAMWGRFYDLETGKPFFCDRDGIKKDSLAEIGHERRNGYSWYTTAPQSVIDAYPAWSAKSE